MNKKDRYEISLWQDELVAAQGEIPEHYEEKKIAIIGSNTMTSQCRAIDPKLVENINGTNTFTFKMYYTYVDTETGKRETNPFLNLLVNERKIKALWKDRWYDFVIKSIQENSGDKSITYTCKDLFVNELSKTGFELEFDNELMNNQGTVQELAERVLEGTDWTVGQCDEVLQKKEEPVYLLIANGEVELTLVEDETVKVIAPDRSEILGFYSDVQSGADKIQVLYAPGNNYQTDGNASQLVVNAKNYYCSLSSTEKGGISELYRGEKLVSSQKQVFDSVLDRYVSVYNYNGKEVYGYQTTEYIDPTLVNNLLVNSKDFTSTNGWLGQDLIFKLYPTFDKNTEISTYNAKTYLKLEGRVLNQGIYESFIYIPNGFQAGEKYIFRYKAQTDLNGSPSGIYSTKKGVTPVILPYKIGDNGLPKVEEQSYFTVGDSWLNGEWIEYELKCTTSITRSEIITGVKIDGERYEIGFFVDSILAIWLEEAEFFPLVKGENGERINPGHFDTLSAARVVYRYYDPDTLIDKENIKYLYSGEEPWNEAEEVSNGFTKIRSISAKNSNRFNILQSLAETFECWAKFDIEHDQETGRVIYDNGAPRKRVRFVNNVGQETGIGFVYGIDLKTIQRTINSDQIITKAIVSPNNNEFAKNGFCTIARSDENYSKESFILNFDYYITQGLLDGGAINKDLYLGGEGFSDSIGYYYYLNKYNTEYDSLTDELIERKNELLKQESTLTVYQNHVSAIAEQLQSIENDIRALAGVDSIDKAKQYITENPNNTKVASLIQNRQSLLNQLNSYNEQLGDLENSHNALFNKIKEIEDRQEELSGLSEELHAKFYKKYSRFIQEGSWTSEEYIDDNIYYLDALSVAYTSSRPKITYNISVIRLSSIEEFKNKVFRLGDISFIQDTEFFGYVYIDGVKTPYKEKVLVSEVTSFFDSPEKDTFKIQNHKTQFEDLFQRITATTQSLQYASGEYAKAANAFTETGELKVETLQNSLALNQQFVISAQNESIISDNTGITVSDTTNPNNKTKITSGGVFISVDGGKTWKNAVRGEGLSTQYLTAGSINANNIMILDGAHPTFRWDAQGINAFAKGEAGINTSIFTRFDQYGIYGIRGDSSFDPESEDDIWENAQFALTWKGFSLKSKHGDGYVQISSDKDIVVSDGVYDRVHIGWFNSDNGESTYGISLKNANGATTMETDDDGKLWLKDSLSVETYNENTKVAIGKLDTEDSKDPEHGGRIIDADKKFVVYEDGFMEATGANVSGTIIAGEGSTFGGVIKAGTIIGGDISAEGAVIGGLTVENLTQTIEDSKGIKISCKKGFNFKTDANGVSSPNKLPLELSSIGVEIDETSILWKGSTNFTTWTTLKQGTFTYELTPGNWDVYYIQAIATEKETSKEYTTWTTITNIKDGTSGGSGEGGSLEYYETELSTDEVVKFKNKDGSITLSPTNISLYTYRIINNLKTRVENFENWIFGLYVALDSNYDSPVLIAENNDLYFQREYKSVGDEENKEQILNEDFLHKHNIPLGDLILSANCNETLLNFIKEQEGVILIKITPPDGPEIILPINFRYGLSSEMATFNIHAAGFNAAIKNSQLSFSEEGLELKNAIIKAIKTNAQGEKKTTFEIDSQGNAYFSGELNAASGTFSGDITAAKGTFSGAISAREGSIGGFIISEGRLYSPIPEGQDSSSLVLYGEEGKVVAKNIEIGTGATITEYIKLGEGARIWNPEFAEGKILEAGSISLTNDGILNIGNIIISGKEGGSIKNSSIDRRWEINSDGTAVFNEIYADNVHLANTILETGSVQTVGSLMLFKDSWAIDEIDEDDNLIINSRVNLEPGDWIYCGKEVYRIFSVNYSESSNSTIISLEEAHSLTNQNIITKFGKSNKDYIFSIFGGAADNSSNLWPFAKNNSLTISSFNEPQETSKEKLQYNTRLILGDLSSIEGGSGFGLYSDNVVLNGSLITNTGNSYAGINTTTGVNALQEFHGEDSSRIVFWAGSDSKNMGDMQKAPFQITENGSLYAQKGHFKGSIITDATIEASTLKAAVIYGSENESNQPTLKIYDAHASDNSGGIGFYSSIGTSTEEDDIEILRITGTGMSVYTKDGDIVNSLNFIKINEGEVAYSGSNYIGNLFQAEDENGRLIIEPSAITRKIGTESGATLQSVITLNDQIGFNIYNESLMNISKEKTTFKDLYEIDYQGQQIIYKFGEKKNMVYRKMTNGYDLLIN